jgi:hypothetical protein
MEGPMIAVVFSGPPGFAELVKQKKKAIRKKMKRRLGQPTKQANFIHSSNLEEAAEEVALWRRWIEQRR